VRATIPFRLDNFTGDGWIILVDDDLKGDRLAAFVAETLSKVRSSRCEKIEPVREITPEVIGVTIGMDRGRLIKFQMNNGYEFVGRALNVACRLQSTSTPM
jgi:class 3 adenylate cyclase